MSKKLTHNKIHRANPTSEDKSQVVSAVEGITASAKSTVKRNRAPLIFLLVLFVLGGLAVWVFQEIKAGQADTIQQRFFDLTSNPIADGQEESRIANMEELLGEVAGQPQEESFYLRIVNTLIEQADPDVANNVSPLSITAITGTPGDTNDAGKHKLLEAAGRLAGAASGKFADLADWNAKIQAVVSEELDKTWLHKPRSYKLLVPRAGASK